MKTLIQKLTSRKFVLTVVGILVSAFGQDWGLTPDQVTKIVGGIGVYAVGEGISDTAKGRING